MSEYRRRTDAEFEELCAFDALLAVAAAHLEDLDDPFWLAQLRQSVIAAKVAKAAARDAKYATAER